MAIRSADDVGVASYRHQWDVLFTAAPKPERRDPDTSSSSATCPVQSTVWKFCPGDCHRELAPNGVRATRLERGAVADCPTLLRAGAHRAGHGSVAGR